MNNLGGNTNQRKDLAQMVTHEHVSNWFELSGELSLRWGVLKLNMSFEGLPRILP